MFQQERGGEGGVEECVFVRSTTILSANRFAKIRQALKEAGGCLQ